MMLMHIAIAVAELLVASTSAIAPQFVSLQDETGQYLVRAPTIATGYEAAESRSPARCKGGSPHAEADSPALCPLKN